MGSILQRNEGHVFGGLLDRELTQSKSHAQLHTIQKTQHVHKLYFDGNDTKLSTLSSLQHVQHHYFSTVSNFIVTFSTC